MNDEQEDKNEENFFVCSLNRFFQSDNNQDGTGKTDQLSAISAYFELWTS